MDRVKRQLAWLARYMSHRAQMIFSVEDLQPDALTPKGAIFHALSVSLLMSLSFGLVIGTAACLISLGWVTMPAAAVDGAIGGLAFAVAIGAGYWTTRGGAFGIAFGVSIGLAVGLPIALSTRSIGLGIVAGLAVAIVTSVVGWLAFGPRGKLVVSRNVIQSVEILSWSWTRASLAFGSVLALCTLAGITIYPMVFPVGAAYGSLVTPGLAWGLGVGLLAGMFFALTRGLTPREVPTRVMPNQGIRWTAQNALRVTVGIALVATLITSFVRLPGFMVGGLVSGGLPYGLLFGLLGWIDGRAAVKGKNIDGDEHSPRQHRWHPNLIFVGDDAAVNPRIGCSS
jgi:hypothetical protein